MTSSKRIHFHAGHNDAGYMPESDVETFDTFADAKTYMIAELLSAADSIASWGDEHDCDDVPCPTYGDECPEQLASSVALEAETLNLESGPEWQAYLSDGRSLPVSWWITPCQESDCQDDEADEDASYVLPGDGIEPDEDAGESLGQIAVDWHGGQSSPLYAFASTGTIVAGLEAEIRDNLKLLVAGQYSAEEINRETPRLSTLLAYVVAETPELDEDDETCSCGSFGSDDEPGHTVYDCVRPLPARYAVTASIQFRRADGWDVSRQVPTFYLDSNVQGIVSEDHARRIAEDVLTAAVPDRTTVRCFITAVAL